MNNLYNRHLTANARNLRNSMTNEERHLWYDFLKQLPVTVHRQKAIGNYIVDFYIASSKIVIELDGSQHYDPEHQLRDQERDACLTNLGYTVLRYSNRDIAHHFSEICQDISNRIHCL